MEEFMFLGLRMTAGIARKKFQKLFGVELEGVYQCVLRGGLPFAVEMPAHSQKTLDAMAEARRISRDPDVRKGYMEKSCGNCSGRD